MPKKKEIDPRGLFDGWRGIAQETVAKFKGKDAEGFGRLARVGRESFGHRENTSLAGELALVAFEPRTARTSSRQAFLVEALASEFDATINLLTFARQEFGKMVLSYRTRARLKLTGTMLRYCLAEYAGQPDPSWKNIAEMLGESPEGKGITNARDAISRARKTAGRMPTKRGKG